MKQEMPKHNGGGNQKRRYRWNRYMRPRNDGHRMQMQPPGGVQRQQSLHAIGRQISDEHADGQGRRNFRAAQGSLFQLAPGAQWIEPAPRGAEKRRAGMHVVIISRITSSMR